MVRLEDIARAAIEGEALQTRSLVQEWLAQTSRFSQVPRPATDDVTVMGVSAALVELFASRRNQPGPSWAAGVGPLEKPLFLLRHAATMPRLRKMCEQESPEPFRRRLIFVPADYLNAA